MRRRDVITWLGGAAAARATAWPLDALAQQTKMLVIGSLFSVSAAEWTNHMAGFRRGLGEAGFIEGRNVIIEYRWAEGQLDRMPAMADDLIGLKAAVILVGGSSAGVRAVMAATQTIPIVFTTGTDPVATGFVASLNRPGRNVTGITLFLVELGPKKLELLREILPAATKFGMLTNPANAATSEADIHGAQTAARSLGLDIIVLNASTENEIEFAFDAAVQQRVAAIYFGVDAFLDSRRQQIAALGLRHALPTISSSREDAQSGVLMSYGTNEPDMYRQAGNYVGRILKGDKPADLPVLQPTRFELVVNLRTAKAIGLNIPETCLVRADEVIE